MYLKLLSLAMGGPWQTSPTLTANKIGDEGMIKLSESLGKGSLASLKELYLGGTQIGDAGVTALADVCAKGALANLTILLLGGNNISDPCVAWASLRTLLPGGRWRRSGSL
jgi:hypothetical protein